LVRYAHRHGICVWHSYPNTKVFISEDNGKLSCIHIKILVKYPDYEAVRHDVLCTLGH